MSWPEVALEELVVEDAPIVYGILKPGPNIQDGVPYVRPTEMGDRQIRLGSVLRTSPKIAQDFRRSTLRTGDLVLSIVGTIGKIAFVPPQLDGGNITQCSVRIRANPKTVDARYLSWALDSPRVRRQYDEYRFGSGVPRLNVGHVRAIQIPHPPLPEQRTIADILDKADAIRRKRNEAIALTEDLLRSTFLEMVGPAAQEYGKWPVRTIESLAASAPNSMRTGPFGSDLLHSEFVDEGIAVLGIDNAVQNRFAWGERRFITPEKYERLRRYTVLPGDVIVTIMGTTGRSAVVPDDIPSAITTKHLATITLDRQQAEPEFVSQALFRHPEVLRQIAAANRGAIMNGLNLGLIKALRIPVPPPERQREFARVTTRIRSLASRMDGHRHDESLFNSLVARAFSGQLSSRTEDAC